MQKTVIGIVLIAMLVASGSAIAQTKVRSWDDLSWYGQSGATNHPVKDAGRSGYWWWPTEPKSNEGDSELWGNRGVVYAMYMPVVQEPAPRPEPPTAPTPPPVRTVPVFNHVLFDFDKSILSAEGRAAIDGVVSGLKSHSDDTVVIEGHTCNVGEESYNLGLGQRRADAVTKYMTDNGISSGRLHSVSKGEGEPAVSNDTPASRKLNRRVVFKYTIGR